MKCTNKIKIVIPVMLTCLLLSGCTERQDLADAYDIYATSDTYQLTESLVSKPVSLFAEKLCVGGQENSSTKGIDSDYAASAAVFTTENKEVSYAQNIYDRRYPASTTKILTAYLALKYGNMEDVITVSSEAVYTLMAGSSICGLQPGDQITLEEALYGLMLCSGNDAANVIAEHISGSTEKFADLMNEEARALGATHSHFMNAHGLPDEDHYTTVYDMYLIFNAAIQNNDFVEYISAKEHQASYLNEDGEKVEPVWYNTNGYLKGDFEMPENATVIGGKTGTTGDAGYCLVLLSENQKKEPVISIVFKGDSREHLYTLMSEMITKFSN